MIIVFTRTLQTWLLVQSQNIASQPWWESSALRGSSSCKQEVTAASKVSAELWAFEEKVLTDSVFPEICGAHAYIFCPCIVLRCSGTWFPSTGRYSPGKFHVPPSSCTLEAAAPVYQVWQNKVWGHLATMLECEVTRRYFRWCSK